VSQWSEKILQAIWEFENKLLIENERFNAIWKKRLFKSKKNEGL
jgi:hypothetical protein